MPELPDISTLAAPLYLVLIAIEVLLIKKGKAMGRYERRDTATSLSMGIGNVITGVLTTGATYGVLMMLWKHRLFTIEFSVWTLALCFLLDDFRYYWSHRFGHRVRWFWACHVVHHYSKHYNLGTALRQPWTYSITGLVVLRMPLVLMGFHPAMIAFVGSLNLFYQFWIHTEAIDRMPRWFELTFNTPSHHRVHHGSNKKYLDANFGGTLIIWDRLFRTFVPEEEPVRYGLVHDIETYHPLRVAFHEYIDIAKDVMRPALKLKDRFRAVFGPPGFEAKP